MSTATTTPDSARRSPSAVTLGWIAVAVVILAFSAGSTLVKSSHAPAVMLAFWRMLMATALWNLALMISGRHISWADVRRAAIPGVMFGLNIMLFFLGVTNNAIANAELIGALSPFLIVPVGARFFGERIYPKAVALALVAFSGLLLVLFAAPASGTASLKGNVFSILSMVAWVTYMATTRAFRGPLDVSQFMAAMLPVSTLTLVPFAAFHDFELLAPRGWVFAVLLALVTGFAGHGLLVYAQRTVGIGSIGIAQVSQPALAVTWSYLFLGEGLNGWQLVGMTLVLAGLLGFFVINRRGLSRRVRETSPAPDGPAPTA